MDFHKMMKSSEKTINVTRSSMPDFTEYTEELRSLWDSRWLTNNGSKHRELKAALAQYLGVDCLELLVNGHMAIELSLQALGLRGEVITTPFTFASITQAIVRSGLTPVFCDIDPVTYTMDTSKIEERITDRTCAILPVHVYGNVCGVEAIESIAAKHGLRVLYDAAHAFGVRYRGRGIGSFGDVSCFSFHATKVFHTIEGGGACFHDAALGVKLARMKDFGINGPEAVDEIGGNGKMNEFCAAMGLCNLRHIDGELQKRRQVVERYRARLEGVAGIRLNPVQPEVETNYAYFPAVFDPETFGASRDQVSDALEARGIKPRKYFYPLTSTFSCYGGRFDLAETPAALRVSRQVLTLPLYADLPLETVDQICGIILGCQN